MKILIFLICFKLALPLYSAEPAVRATPDNPPAPKAESSRSADPARLTPGPNDGAIATETVRMLEGGHYLHLKLDDTVSSKFLDRYLNSPQLDPQHMHFLQSDLADFERFRTTLDDLTKRGDTSPAYEIATRFIQRLEQRVAYVNELLKTEKLEFNSDDRITLNRHELPYPKDIKEARQLWRDRLRYEMLQEKLIAANSFNLKVVKLHVAKPADGTERKPEAKPPENKDQPAKVKTPEEIHAEIVKNLSKRYARVLKDRRDWDRDNVLELYLTALAHVYDPHSDYLGKAQLENFAIGMNLSLFGIGAELISDLDGYCTIQRLLPGPAANSKKINVKDRIVAVAQGDKEPADVVGMPLSKVVELIRGPKGTEVRLTIIPPEAADSAARTMVSLIRDKIKLEDQEAKAKIIEYPAGKGESLRLGIIDLPSFYAHLDVAGATDKPETDSSTTDDVTRLIKKLEQEKVSGLILDLRRNGGGSLDEAIKLTGLFIKQGPVVQVRDSSGRKKIETDKNPSILYDGPLIVLTSHFSASASEIVAGALQDYGRALIVGDATTHGKGTVQAMQQFDPGLGALKITIRKFYRPKGSSTQKKGVIPDIRLPSVYDYTEYGEAFLENPLEWDTIDSAQFEPVNRVQPFLAELEKHSAKRVATEKDFDYVREDIEQVKKAMADKTVSLNEKQRLKEKEEAEALQKAREKERRTRKESKEKVYELALKQVDLPGLPSPVAKTNTAAIIENKNSVPEDQTPANSKTNPGVVIARQLPARSDGDPVGAHPASGLDGDDDEEKPPAVDIDLEETKHILVDYLSLLRNEAVLTVNGNNNTN